MRRLVKEDLLKFDGSPLFPERRAYTVNYDLSLRETVLVHRSLAPFKIGDFSGTMPPFNLKEKN